MGRFAIRFMVASTLLPFLACSEPTAPAASGSAGSCSGHGPTKNPLDLAPIPLIAWFRLEGAYSIEGDRIQFLPESSVTFDQLSTPHGPIVQSPYQGTIYDDARFTVSGRRAIPTARTRLVISS